MMMTNKKKKKKKKEKKNKTKKPPKTKDKMTRHGIRVDVCFLNLPTEMGFSEKKMTNDSNGKEQ